MSKKRRAFNLIEVTIVVSVLLTLTLMAFECHGKYINEAKAVAQATDVKRLESVKALYWFANNGQEAKDDEALQHHYVIDKEGNNEKK